MNRIVLQDICDWCEQNVNGQLVHYIDKVNDFSHITITRGKWVQISIRIIDNTVCVTHINDGVRQRLRLCLSDPDCFAELYKYLKKL